MTVLVNSSMDYPRNLRLKAISAQGYKGAQGLKNAYCQVSCAGYPDSEQKMFIVDINTPNSMEFVVDEHGYLVKSGAYLLFRLTKHGFFRQKEIGHVYVPVKELYPGNPSSTQERTVEYQFFTKSGEAKGLLKFAYTFDDKLTQPDKSTPPDAYPAYNTQQKRRRAKRTTPPDAYPAYNTQQKRRRAKRKGGNQEKVLMITTSELLVCFLVGAMIGILAF